MCKKIIRIVVILYIIIFLTGCDLEYNLNISNDSIDELTHFKFVESDYNYELFYDLNDAKHFSSMDELVNNVINDDYLAFDENDNDKLYSKSKTSDGIGLSYKYDYVNFDKSSMLNYCGNTVDYSVKNNIVNIRVDNFTDCFMQDYGPYLNNLSINIKTNLDVLDNNADKVNGNVYTWNMNIENVANKKLNLVIRNKSLKDDKESILKNDSYWIFFVIILFLLFVCFSLFYFFKKRKESNEI